MERLKNFFNGAPKLALAFSGGADSAFLLKVGTMLGADIRPYFVKTPFQPQFEYDDAMRLGDICKAEINVLHLDVLGNENIKNNSENRCYFCKKAIFSALTGRAALDGYTLVADGTNASDSFNDRPGMRALEKFGVRSPLREAGITKSEVRRLSRELGLFTWDKPSYSCLATRVPHGTEISEDILSSIERSEEKLMAMGFSGFRLRYRGNWAKLEVDESQFHRAAEMHREILNSLSPYFPEIYLDLKGRVSDI